MKKKYFVVVTDPSDKDGFLAVTVKAKSAPDAVSKARKSFVVKKTTPQFTHFQVFNHHADYFKGGQLLLEKDLPIKGVKK